MITFERIMYVAITIMLITLISDHISFAPRNEQTNTCGFVKKFTGSCNFKKIVSDQDIENFSHKPE